MYSVHVVDSIGHQNTFRRVYVDLRKMVLGGPDHDLVLENINCKQECAISCSVRSSIYLDTILIGSNSMTINEL